MKFQSNRYFEEELVNDKIREIALASLAEVKENPKKLKHYLILWNFPRPPVMFLAM